jgi:hypothetical protein
MINAVRHLMTAHSTAQHSTAQHSTAQHSTAQHSTAQHSTEQRRRGTHSTARQVSAVHPGSLDEPFINTDAPRYRGARTTRHVNSTHRNPERPSERGNLSAGLTVRLHSRVECECCCLQAWQGYTLIVARPPLIAHAIKRHTDMHSHTILQHTQCTC